MTRPILGLACVGLLQACASSSPPPSEPGVNRVELRGALIARPIALYFASTDTNLDGIVELGELKARSAETFRTFDRDTNGRWSLVDHGDWSLTHLGAQYAVPSGLQTDTNGDGTISEGEFIETLEDAFTRMDKNADGRLIREEMVTALPVGRSRDPDEMRRRMMEEGRGRRRGDRRQ